MIICSNCGSSTMLNHVLEDDRVPPMSNSDRIIGPRCKTCLERLTFNSNWHSEDEEQRVILITGICGAGKSSIGKKLEKRTGYIHIDGDAISKRVNWDIRNGYLEKRSGYRVFKELLETIQVVLQLGYSVTATYVFPEEIIRKYIAEFTKMQVKSNVFVLKTDKNTCLKRDAERVCWTAGEEFVMKWYDEQNQLAEQQIGTVIDNSFEELDETVHKIMTLQTLK